MQIVTNPGSNLGRDVLARYGIHLTPQQIVVDGVSYDTREPISFEQVDRWVKQAKDFPHVVGTTTPEFVSALTTLVKQDRDILAVMTSRKIIKSYDAAVNAAKAVQARPGWESTRISVIDSEATDLVPGLLTIAAGEAARAGWGLPKTAKMLEFLAPRSRLVGVTGSVDYLMKSGRAGWLRGWIATMLELRPLIGFVDGETKSVGRVSKSADAGDAIITQLMEQIGEGRRVWAGVFHGNAPDEARVLLAKLEKRFQVEYSHVRGLSPSIYLFMGPGTIGAAVVPVDGLPTPIPTPPTFSSEP